VLYGDKCQDLMCSWNVEAMNGGHTLYVVSTYAPDDYVGMTIGVYVHGVNDSSVDTSTSTTAPSTTETSTGSGANDDTSKACGCAAPSHRSNALFLIAPLALLARRRRAITGGCRPTPRSAGR